MNIALQCTRLVSLALLLLKLSLASSCFSEPHVNLLSWTAVFLACGRTHCYCSSTRMEKIQTREGKVLDMANQQEGGLGLCTIQFSVT